MAQTQCTIPVANTVGVPLYPGMHVDDERHYVFECPAFNDVCRGFSISLMTVIGPSIVSCSTHTRRMLLCHACLIEIMRL